MKIEHDIEIFESAIEILGRFTILEFELSCCSDFEDKMYRISSKEDINEPDAHDHWIY